MKFWLSIILIVGPLILGTYLSIAQESTIITKIIIWVICLVICSVGVFGTIRQQKEEKEKEKKEKYYHQLQEKQELRGRGFPEVYIDGLGKNPLLKHFFNSGQRYEKEYKFKQAIEEYGKCLSHPGATEENKVAANILTGNCYSYLSELKEAEKHYKEALTISEKVKDKSERLKGKSIALGNLGCVYVNLGDFKKAIEYHEKSLEIAKKIGDKADESACYGNLGVAYFNLGNFKKAIEYYEKSLGIAKKIGDKADESACYGNLGVAYFNLGDFKKSIEYYLKAEKIFIETRQSHHLKTVYFNLSLAYEKLGDDENAKKYKGLANSK